MPLVTYLHHIDLYRYTDYPTPWPLPGLCKPADLTIMQRWTATPHLRGALNEILTHHGIVVPANNNCTIHACTKPRYPDGHNGRYIVRIHLNVSDDEEEHTDKWPEARTAISTLLSEHGLEDITVELGDEARAFTTSLHPLHPDHVAIPAHRSCKATLLDLLHERLPRHWTTMGRLYRLKRPTRELTVAVVVMVKPYTSCNWAMLKQKFLHVVNRVYTGRTQLGRSLPRYSNTDPQRTIQGFDDLEKGQWYFKTGRSTGLTSGTCHGAETNIKPERLYRRHHHSETLLWSMMMNPNIQDFCRGEDSELDDHRDRSGMLGARLFGDITGYTSPPWMGGWGTGYANAGQVTAMTSVLESIATKVSLRRRQVTGLGLGDGELAELRPGGGGGSEGELRLGHL
ncbi:MAG: hypothetical protein Q9219_000692 [cf. Caloplaca sp. 3 TL-2023]